MINLHGIAVRSDPFPHCIIDDLFDATTFERLAAAFPDCPAATGPTGFTIHRGDPEFESIMASSADWRDFFTASNSPEFVNSLARLFDDEIERFGHLKTHELRFVDHIETRSEKESGAIKRLHLNASDIHIRFDFMQGRDAYLRQPHLDHRRRLATILVYFEGPGPETFSGGDLILHDAQGVEQVRISPAPNRAVLFPCSERSWHSVEPVRACRRPRNLIQITATSRQSLWSGGQLPGMGQPQWRRALALCRRAIRPG